MDYQAIPIFSNRTYQKLTVKIADLYGGDESGLLYGNGRDTGYPINKIILALTFLVAAVTDQLNGLRPRGSKDDIISGYLKEHPDAVVFIQRPDLLTPVVLQMGGYAAIVGPSNPKVYRKLIRKSPDNPYKIIVRAISPFVTTPKISRLSGGVVFPYTSRQPHSNGCSRISSLIFDGV